MTTFIDGPAKDSPFLLLRRAPHFLRAVRSRGQSAPREWDALDQLDDEPRETEEIYAYEMVGEPTYCHINARNRGGVYRGGKYKLVDPQPEEAIMRNAVSWREWCRANFKGNVN